MILLFTIRGEPQEIATSKSPEDRFDMKSFDLSLTVYEIYCMKNWVIIIMQTDVE